MNQSVLVGRLVDDPFLQEKNEETCPAIKIAVTRSYKEIDGEYKTDFLTIYLQDCIRDKVFEYCKNGDVVGVKGRIETRNDQIVIIAEKVTFLSSRKEFDE